MKKPGTTEIKNACFPICMTHEAFQHAVSRSEREARQPASKEHASPVPCDHVDQIQKALMSIVLLTQIVNRAHEDTRVCGPAECRECFWMVVRGAGGTWGYEMVQRMILH